jgi:CBS domain-containing protein
VDIPSFLRMYPPFDDLDDERLADVVARTRIEFFPEGAVIFRQGGQPSRSLYIVRTGKIEFVDGDQVVDLHTEGEPFGFVSLLTGLAPAATVRAAEDTICYAVDGDVARGLLASRRGLAFLASTLRRREMPALRRASPQAGDPMQAPVSGLVRRPPIEVAPTTTAGEAAALMSGERVSCVLVADPRGRGIVTDRDLRSRVLAAGRGPEVPVAEIHTFPVESVTPDTPVGEVTALMLERGIHHVIVQPDDGDPIGVVTHVDLIGFERRTPFTLRVDIERSSTSEEAIEEARQLPAAVATLVAAGGDPIDIANVIGVTTDTLTERLLELAIEELGDPPCPWAWIALGSQARHEQGLASDQDNALAIEPGQQDRADVDAYFQRLTDMVIDGLDVAGFARCRAGVVASNPAWRGTADEWVARFHSWIDEPGRLGTALTGIAFDFRPVAGPLDITRHLEPVIRDAGRSREFVRRLGQLAIDGRAPTTLRKGPKRADNATVLDLKRTGITLVTNLARTWAINAGFTERRTLRRLAAVGSTRALSGEIAEGLDEAFRFLWQVRLESQVESLYAERVPDDLADVEAMGPLTRQGLREAFRMIDQAQELLAVQLGLRR